MYRYWLANIPGMTPSKYEFIYRNCSCAEELYMLSDRAIGKMTGLSQKDAQSIVLSRKKWNLEQKWQELMESGAGFVSWEDDAYPGKLKTIAHAPYALYYVGKLPDEKRKRVAIVGARGRSAYGSQVAGKLAKRLAEANVDVISGMALGIDTDSHFGALDGKGNTYAVLGCGVDVCYPKSNQRLYEKITTCGGILSEYALHTPPLPAYFPQRNRIIAGLADYTVVIEARLKSGSLITADYAMEQGREVYALPGRITDELSQGCNSLIQQGAGVLHNIDDFLKTMELDSAFCMEQMDYKKNLLEKDESLVYSLFDFHPLGVGTMVERSPYTLSQLLDILERLENKGFIKENIPNYYIKNI